MNINFEDLKIGTKVIFENGECLVKNSEFNFESECRFRPSNELHIDEADYVLGNIIKIEEPVDFKTVYERKELLTEKERNYLKAVIEPVKDKVKYIFLVTDNDLSSHIRIKLDNDTICLYSFKTGEQFKKLKLDKSYTLEELNLL